MRQEKRKVRRQTPREGGKAKKEISMKGNSLVIDSGKRGKTRRNREKKRKFQKGKTILRRDKTEKEKMK